MEQTGYARETGAGGDRQTAGLTRIGWTERQLEQSEVGCGVRADAESVIGVRTHLAVDQLPLVGRRPTPEPLFLSSPRPPLAIVARAADVLTYDSPDPRLSLPPDSPPLFITNIRSLISRCIRSHFPTTPLSEPPFCSNRPDTQNKRLTAVLPNKWYARVNRLSVNLTPVWMQDKLHRIIDLTTHEYRVEPIQSRCEISAPRKIRGKEVLSR